MVDARISDVNEVYRFVDSLKKYAEQLYEETRKMIVAVNRVNEYWEDDVHANFMQEVEPLLSQINHLHEIITTHTAYAKRKADQANEYKTSR